MARQFFPVPYEAADICDDCPLLVWWLYRKAHRTRWRPFAMTERRACDAAGIGNRRLWSALDDLRAAGLLTYEKGGRRRPTYVTVFDPSEVQQGEQQARQQNGTGSSGKTDEPAALDAALDAAPIRDEPEPEPEPTKNSGRAAAIREVWEAWRDATTPNGEQPHQRCRKVTAAQRPLLNARFEDGHTVEELVNVVQWAHRAGWYYERQAWALETLMRGERMTQRIEEAQRWKARGGGGGGVVLPMPETAAQRRRRLEREEANG